MFQRDLFGNYEKNWREMTLNLGLHSPNLSIKLSFHIIPNLLLRRVGIFFFFFFFFFFFLIFVLVLWKKDGGWVGERGV